MYTGTTPTYTLTFEDVDLTTASAVAVTICDPRRNVIVELDTDDLVITETTIQFTLTQEQTLALPNGTCLMQVNFTYADGERMARACSNIVQIDFKANLKLEVME